MRCDAVDSFLQNLTVSCNAENGWSKEFQEVHFFLHKVPSGVASMDITVPNVDEIAYGACISAHMCMCMNVWYNLGSWVGGLKISSHETKTQLRKEMLLRGKTPGHLRLTQTHSMIPPQAKIIAKHQKLKNCSIAKTNVFLRLADSPVKEAKAKISPELLAEQV